ncbi:hypothetical protein V8G54_004835 [Vigna mungo]|uniref:NAC domain-containing protein n=1 Tax=Vigna mungo TaxID=3915 RepID=A0AAQ3PCF0_VIGMU
MVTEAHWTIFERLELFLSDSPARVLVDGDWGTYCGCCAVGRVLPVGLHYVTTSSPLVQPHFILIHCLASSPFSLESLSTIHIFFTDTQGLALSSIGEYKKAEDAHLKSLQIDRNFLEAWAHLTQASINLIVKDYDAALDLELDSMDKFVLQCLAFYQVAALTTIDMVIASFPFLPLAAERPLFSPSLPSTSSSSTVVQRRRLAPPSSPLDSSLLNPIQGTYGCFRLHPTDKELVVFYLNLKRKITGNLSQYDHIAVVDVYKLNPGTFPVRILPFFVVMKGLGMVLLQRDGPQVWKWLQDQPRHREGLLKDNWKGPSSGP